MHHFALEVDPLPLEKNLNSSALLKIFLMLVKFLLSTKFWTNLVRWNFSSQLVLMKLTHVDTNTCTRGNRLQGEPYS